MELPRGSPPPPDDYFASEFNFMSPSPSPSSYSSSGLGAPDDSSESGSEKKLLAKWALRGFYPPRNLRIDKYKYASPPEESDGELGSVPNTPKRECVEMIVTQ